METEEEIIDEPIETPMTRRVKLDIFILQNLGFVFRDKTEEEIKADIEAFKQTRPKRKKRIRKVPFAKRRELCAAADKLRKEGYSAKDACQKVGIRYGNYKRTKVLIKKGKVEK